MNRKKGVFVLGIFILLAGAAAALFFQAKSREEEKSCEKQLFAMDTYMEFTAYGKKCEQAVDAAIEKVQSLDALLSAQDEKSEIYALNQAGSLEVSGDTAALLARAQEIYEDTDRLFDITIYPVMELWGFPTGAYHVPTQEELEEVLPLVDASKVRLGETVTLSPGQKVDLGGIAKGYTSAAVMEIFREYGISSGMVSLGGNIQALGAKPDGTAWNIGIRDPMGGQNDYFAILSVKDKAVVTSGGYERYFQEDGETYIHIIDPRTGRPAAGDLLSVTVISQDGTLADALSTSLFIMGREEACGYWQEHKKEFDMVLVTDEEEIYVTEGIQEDFRSEEDWTVVK